MSSLSVIHAHITNQIHSLPTTIAIIILSIVNITVVDVVVVIIRVHISLWLLLIGIQSGLCGV